MTPTWNNRARLAARDFAERVWPEFAEELGGGRLEHTERDEAGIGAALDLMALTDAWQIVPGVGARSIASRVQWGRHNWESWTVRARLPSGARTELHKLLAGDGWHLPDLIVQAYLTGPGGTLISAAAICGSDLVSLLRRRSCVRGPRRNGEDGVEFFWVAWEDAERYGIPIIRRPRDWFSVARPVT